MGERMGRKYYWLRSVMRLATHIIVAATLLAATVAVRAASQEDHKNCYVGKGDPAIAACSRIISDQTEPLQNRARAYLNRGVEYEAKKNHDSAIADYNEAIRLDPNYADAYYDRGNVYFDKNDYDLAIVNYNEAIRLNPKCANCFDNRGAAYFFKGSDDARAIADFSEAIRLNPRDAKFFKHRALIYRDKGDKARADADEAEAARLAR